MEARLESERQMLAQSEELEKLRAEQRSLKDVHEVEIHKYIDAATFEEIKAKAY